MEPQAKISRMPLRLVLSGAGAAILLAATVLSGAYLGSQTQQRFGNIDASWRLYVGEAERRGELLSRIRSRLGYGGIIHNFKNYVLRKDPRYLEALRRQLHNFTATVKEYRKSGATPYELAHLATIERTIATYQAKIPIAVRAAKENWSPVRTDRLVRVDDTDALKALRALDAYWRDKRRETAKTIAETVAEGENLVAKGFFFLGGLAVVAMVLYALFYLLQRELRQTIGLLSNELNERRAAEHIAKKFQRAVEQSPVTIIITDTEGRIEYVNRKFCDLTGYAPGEVLGGTPRILQSGDEPEETYLGLRQQLARGEEWYGTFHNKKKDGNLYWAKTAILPLRDDQDQITHFIGLGEDITERKKAREQMHRAQKMEAVGLLASGVAHDFNNVLTVILGNVHLARLDAPEEGEFAEELEQIEIAAKRARNLVGQVLAFARRQPGKAVALRVGDIIREVARLMRASTQSNIEIVCEIENDDIYIRADPTWLHQVIMNLCSNAGEAIGLDGGKITLQVRRTQALDGEARVVLAVIDTGPGIAEDILGKVFDPFFTTKPVGKGTGLGLCVVANLVAEMNAQITVASPPGKGTTFEVLLPQCTAPPQQAMEDEKPAGGAGTVLLIDDEREVVNTCAKILRRLDYEVEAFTSPKKAIAAFQSAPERYALVMSDFLMHEMNGDILCARVRALRPHCPIIIYSAYRPSALKLATLEPVRLLEKPVEAVLLSRTVQELLSTAGSN